MNVRRIGIAVVAIAAAAALAGCANGEQSPGGTPPPAGQQPAPARDFSQADVDFAQGMIPHHKQAVAMVDMIPGHGASPQVTAMAGRIRDAQQPEIETMNGWLRDWGVPGVGMSGMDHGSMSGMDHGSMPGMMSQREMARLGAARGPAFDRQWLEMMIQHHEGALDMARKEQADGRNPAAKQLADDVISSQRAEIDEMTRMLRE